VPRGTDAGLGREASSGAGRRPELPGAGRKRRARGYRSIHNDVALMNLATAKLDPGPAALPTRSGKEPSNPVTRRVCGISRSGFRVLRRHC
jgi:hypothetical protein